MTDEMKVFIYLPQNATDAKLVRAESSTLATLQALVEGLVTVVSTSHGDVWCNDEGLYRDDFCQNLVASLLTGYFINGPAVIADSDDEGETISARISTIAYLSAVGVGLDTNGGYGWTVDDIVAQRAAERASV